MRAWSGGGAARARGVGECVWLATGGAAAGPTVAATGLPGPAVRGHAVRGHARRSARRRARDTASDVYRHDLVRHRHAGRAHVDHLRRGPEEGIYVFAPGTHYRPVAIRLDTGSLLRVHGSKYPKPIRFLFKPLKEEVLVYDAPFRLALTVVAGDAEALRSQLRGLHPNAQSTRVGTPASTPTRKTRASGPRPGPDDHQGHVRLPGL